jgi:hypothetical protein
MYVQLKKKRGCAITMVSQNGFIMQHAYSADGQTLQQHVQNVGGHPSLGATKPYKSLLALKQE